MSKAKCLIEYMSQSREIIDNRIGSQSVNTLQFLSFIYRFTLRSITILRTRTDPWSLIYLLIKSCLGDLFKWNVDCVLCHRLIQIFRYIFSYERDSIFFLVTAAKTINCQYVCHFVKHFHAYKCVSLSINLNFEMSAKERKKIMHVCMCTESEHVCTNEHFNCKLYKSHFLVNEYIFFCSK